ncbi:MAG: site-2 protease family protein [Synergistaceae bacterium]|jgi:regulator of sigma E protease|nr:site-2 protease family protein [Synergistaceae bacterium]
MLISLLAFLLVIVVCVVIHEGGHFWAAVWRNVQVHEFAFGMGPKLFSRRKNGVLWSIRALPIGGFVRMEGDESEPLPEDEPDPTRSFPIKRAWERFVIVAGGAFFNILLAWFLTSILLAGYGVLDLESPVVGKLMDGYPAQTMGAAPGDRVISINGESVNEWKDIRSTLQASATSDVTVVVERGDTEVTLRGDIPYSEEDSARLWGVQPSRVTYGPGMAFLNGLTYCWRMSVEILSSLWLMVTGRLHAEVTGPVGIAEMAGNYVREGFWSFITFLAVINLNLGLLNLLPFPALDGGRLVFILGEMVFRRKFPEVWENRIHIVGLAMLLALIAFVTLKDLARLMG